MTDHQDRSETIGKERITSIERSSGLSVAPFDDGAVVIDSVRDATHLLHPFAAWLLAPEEPTTIDEVVALVASTLQIDAADAREHVEHAVVQLAELELVNRAGPSPEYELMPSMIDTPQAGWHVGATHGVADATIAFCGPDRDLVATVDDFFGAPLADVEATGFIGLTPTPDGGIDLDAMQRWPFPSLEQLLWQLPGVVNDLVIHQTVKPLVHAGMVRTPDGTNIVVTGPMDTGKSTLVAALVQAGCDYAGDESIAVDPDELHAFAYPKPLSLDPSAQELLGLDPIGELYTPSEHRRAHELRADAVNLSGDVGPIDLIVHTSYRPGADRTAERLEPAHALELVITNALNLGLAGETGLGALSRIAETIPVLAVVHGDSFALARDLLTGGSDASAIIDAIMASSN